jgi:1-deoxy-D-xylulose-5-phosphate reductoisomerase
MGAKITIDSATMMNKGFEVIEAKWLFNCGPEAIHVVVHPQSIVHSMVEFEDGAVIAQLGHPDMREPIQFAICFPERKPLNVEKLDFAKIGSLTFFEPDTDKFPALSLAFKAIEKGGNVPCAMNAANEVAVAAYLDDKIGFYDISDIVNDCIDTVNFVKKPSLDDIFQTNKDIFEKASSLISKYSGGTH